MKQPYKLRFVAFVIAVLLAVGGLVAQSHSAYAGIGVHPPSGPRSQSPVFDPAQAIVLNWENNPPKP